MALHPADSSAALKAHIKASEKLILHAYFDPVGVPTAGWGHIDGITSSMAKVKQAISTAQAAKWFEEDLDIAERAVPNQNVDDNQWPAFAGLTITTNGLYVTGGGLSCAGVYSNTTGSSVSCSGERTPTQLPFSTRRGT